MDRGFLEVPGVPRSSAEDRVGAEMSMPSEHECNEDMQCIDCRGACCAGCTVVVTLPDGREFSQCARCADAEEADREEDP